MPRRAWHADGWGQRKRRWHLTFRIFLGVSGPQKPKILSIWVQEWLINGLETARGTAEYRLSAKPMASASPRGDRRSWGVTFPSDQASRRASPAHARMPPWPFSPTLYLNSREVPRSQGASWVVCDYGVPPYYFSNLYGVFNSRFCISFSCKTARLKEPSCMPSRPDEG